MFLKEITWNLHPFFLPSSILCISFEDIYSVFLIVKLRFFAKMKLCWKNLKIYKFYIFKKSEVAAWCPFSCEYITAFRLSLSSKCAIAIPENPYFYLKSQYMTSLWRHSWSTYHRSESFLWSRRADQRKFFEIFEKFRNGFWKFRSPIHFRFSYAREQTGRSRFAPSLSRARFKWKTIHLPLALLRC